MHLLVRACLSLISLDHFMLIMYLGIVSPLLANAIDMCFGENNDSDGRFPKSVAQTPMPDVKKQQQTASINCHIHCFESFPAMISSRDNPVSGIRSTRWHNHGLLSKTRVRFCCRVFHSWIRCLSPYYERFPDINPHSAVCHDRKWYQELSFRAFHDSKRAQTAMFHGVGCLRLEKLIE